MEVRLPRRRFPPGLPGFPGNLRKRHFLPFFRLCAAASSPALLCCSERGVAELLGCGLVRAALGMQSMTEPELKALMEQCTEAVTAAADATEARRALYPPQHSPAPQPAHRFSLRSPQDGSIFCLGSPRRPTSTSLARFPRRPEHGTARARLLARAPSSKSRRAFVGKTSDATLLSSRGG